MNSDIMGKSINKDLNTLEKNDFKTYKLVILN